ncbi:glycosyltransferase [Mycolicibacterium phlei]|uniref:glycosyltransferase n=1 Tax=Mycolicibacterium phlei TaxID=1771 RepID=UPI00058F451F|nr:glycosyltransferase [Mycolicibacterium phlei]MBF4194663.1 family 2 glycosyl transferase [Mycolicibacterium phlei]
MRGRMCKWTIAICTVYVRKGLLRRLLDRLEPQIGDRDIEILIADQEDWPLAEKRQWCLDNAKGEYFNFIDDDDLVAENYVEAIYPLLDGVDYIGFRLQYYHDGEPWKPTFHSLRYGVHAIYADSEGFYRGVSHLNPIRTEIARQGRYYGGYGEDNRWCAQVNPVTEHYIDQVMYHYYFSPANSLTHGRQ